MRLLILLACVWCVCAEDVIFNGQPYEKTLLSNEVKSAGEFSYSKKKETLFFAYHKWNNELYTDVASLKVSTDRKHSYNDISGPTNGFTTAIDPVTETVYLAGRNGIYKYNPRFEISERFTANNVDILYLYYDTLLYYITREGRRLYSFDGVENKELKSSAVSVQNEDKFIGHGSEWFTINDDNSKLYRAVWKNEVLESEELYTNPGHNLTGFARDNNNEVFVFGGNAVYVPNRAENKLDKVMDLNDETIYGLTFDKDNNVIYSDHDGIYRLTRKE